MILFLLAIMILVISYVIDGDNTYSRFRIRRLGSRRIDSVFRFGQNA